jgi:hypothetical protein
MNRGPHGCKIHEPTTLKTENNADCKQILQTKEN